MKIWSEMCALTSPINTTLLNGAAAHLEILVTPCLACQYSHIVQPLLKMYTKEIIRMGMIKSITIFH